MGRKRLYITQKEWREANRIKSMRHYWKNSEKIREKNLTRYYENKRANFRNEEIVLSEE